MILLKDDTAVHPKRVLLIRRVKPQLHGVPARIAIRRGEVYSNSRLIDQ